jgi:hypothetical protein
MLVISYLAEALRTLKPTIKPTPSPFKLLALLDKKQWIFFGVGPQNSSSIKTPWLILSDTDSVHCVGLGCIRLVSFPS